MEKVFLRVYDREIEGMIEGGQLGEAVGHCQHILKTFPMHIETYRLLGKAFLEARSYQDAADIFQRVLMSVPDDFVSNVGMSIIRDDEKKLDDAIWHMERAFEVQPSNSAIQGELRRLYGRRDGVEPPKIRLSRDALANMYSQGELFNQAIAEIRSVLADEPNRPDLQVMLMRAYYHSGQKVEAAEIAATLLKKYPYCLDSLRVLVDVLPGTARAENAQVYRQRLFLLDPYAAFTKDSVFFSNQVADSAVNLERLDYKPGAFPETIQTDWSSSLGIKSIPEKRSEPPPKWMQTPEIAEEPAKSIPESAGIEAAPAVNSTEDVVPDWMRSAEWLDSSDQTKDDSTEQGDNPPEESIARADIPDWLKSMAPAEAIEEANAEVEEPDSGLSAGEDGIPGWRKPMVPTDAGDDGQIESPEFTDSVSETRNKPTAPVDASSENSLEPKTLVEAKPESEETVQELPESIAQAEAAGESLIENQQPIEPEPESDEKIPEWLKSMAPAEAFGEIMKEYQEPVKPRTESGEDFPDWLRSMTPAEQSEEMLNETKEPIEHLPESEKHLPDWLKTMGPMETPGEAPIAAEQPVDTQPAPGENVPDLLTSIAPAVVSDTSIEESEESLPKLSAMKSENELPHLEAASAGEEAFPDWLKGMDSDTAAASPSVAETLGSSESIGQPIPDQTVPVEPVLPVTSDAPISSAGMIEESIQSSEEVKPLNIEDDALGWLDSLAAKQGAKQGAKPEEVLSRPLDRSVEIPDWLHQAGDETVSPPVDHAHILRHWNRWII
jgi:tetratricopeptide (TPR) repeat protein